MRREEGAKTDVLSLQMMVLMFISEEEGGGWEEKRETRRRNYLLTSHNPVPSSPITAHFRMNEREGGRLSGKLVIGCVPATLQ